MNRLNPEKVQEDHTRGCAEIERRKVSRGGGPTVASAIAPVENFEKVGQALVLYNFAHCNRRPQSSRPAFRILGLFADDVALMSHVNTLQTFGHECDLHKGKARMFVLLTVNTVSRATALKQERRASTSIALIICFAVIRFTEQRQQMCRSSIQLGT